METYEDTRSPEQIERDIERTRSEMAGTLDNIHGTLGDIQSKFSPDQMLDQAVGYLDEKSEQISSAVMNAVRVVPITLIGVGLAWLASTLTGPSSSGRRSSRHASMPRGRTHGSRYGSVDYGSSRMTAGMTASSLHTGGYGSSHPLVPEHAMGERAFTERRLRGERRANSGAGSTPTWTGVDRRHGDRRTGMSMGYGTGQGVGHRVGEVLGETRSAVGHAAETVKHKASEAADTVRHKASETAGQVRETVGHVRERASELTDEARQRTLEVSHRLQDQTRQLIDEQPLILGALGIAIGAALGASLPRTRQEDRLMGEARDELLHRADETGGEVLREVREQVRTGVESLETGQRRETERAESSPITAGSSSGAILSEQERRQGTSGTGSMSGTSGGIGSTSGTSGTGGGIGGTSGTTGTSSTAGTGSMRGTSGTTGTSGMSGTSGTSGTCGTTTGTSGVSGTGGTSQGSTTTGSRTTPGSTSGSGSRDETRRP